jgi:creatinine amidohydrolase
MAHFNWHDLTTVDFAAADPERWVAVLPVAATEQHGPHLPVSVDCTINTGILDRAMALVPDDLMVLRLPLMAVGKSNEHAAFPGTLTLSAETLIRLWTELGESVARAGLRKLVLFNTHGGQPQVADIVARDLRVRLGMLAVTANAGGLGMPEGLFDAGECRHGIHAGAIETSMMMHLRPDLVRHDRLADFPSRAAGFEERYALLRAEGGIGIGWQTQDLNPDGAAGNAAAADPERGRILVEHAAHRFVALLDDVARFPLSDLRTR